MIAEPVLVFEELAQFLANLSPRKVIAFRTSPKSQERVTYLIAKNKERGLSEAEDKEMEQYMQIEHVVQLAQAKALTSNPFYPIITVSPYSSARIFRTFSLCRYSPYVID
jgi:hypothetical protein